MGNIWQLFMTSIAAVGAVFAHSSVTIAPPVTPAGQTAMIAENVSELVSLQVLYAAENTSTASATPVLKPGLLPVVKLNAAKPAAKPKTAPVVAAKSAAAPPPSPPKPAGPAAMTAQAFLNATTLSFIETRDGPFEAVFTSGLPDGTSLTWRLANQTIGGTASVASQFTTSYSCDPPPTSPLPGAGDENPTFDVDAPYDCTIGLAALSGSDRTVHSKDFSFTTPGGQLIVTPPASMDTVLVDNENDGGFVFNNEDTQPITLEGLTVDVSYTALNLQYGPLVLRFADPETDLSLADYHLENIPADPSVPFTHDQSGIQIPLSFTIPPQTKKMIPVQVLGVHKMSIQGVDPTVTVTLRSIETDHAPPKLVLGQAEVSWSCVVPIGSYDPNATDSAFAAGNACQQ